MSIKSKVKQALLGAPGERIRTIRGGVLKGFKFPIDTADSSMRLVGLWETEVVSAVRDLAASAAIACDIGSNSGYYTLYFASRPNIQRVFGFEPDTALVKLAIDNLAANDPAFVAKTTFISKFVGDRDEANWCRLDNELSGMEGPFAFKIDVDGGELEVLRSARRTLASKPCRLVIETHSVELEQQCVALLTELGYQTRIIKNGWYRVIVPETRNIPHNRWMAAWK